MKKIKEIFSSIPILLFAIPFVIILLPFVTVFSVFNFFINKVFKIKYKKYLKTIDGTYFFCYNNRKNSQKFIEENIIPILSKDIKIVFLDGKIVNSNYEQKYISKTITEIKDRKGFPYLLKVSNGEIIDKSINNEFYNIKNQNTDLKNLKAIMNEFYN